MSAPIYDDLLRLADALYAAADTHSKPFALDRMNLQALYDLRAGSLKQHKRDTVVHVSLEIVQREVANARKSHGPKPHSKAILALLSLARAAVDGRGAGATTTARAVCRGLVAGLDPLPEWAANFIRVGAQAPRPEALRALTGLSQSEWNRLAAAVAKTTLERQRSFADRLADESGRSVDLNVAARLSRLASKEETRVGNLPTYDTSEGDLRLRSVTVRGFRGSPGTVQLDLTKSGKAVDALLWGDNGTGKSTLVDGIEFALQRRVDRSADFNSSLRSSVRNLAVQEAMAVVMLSDGTTVQRGLVTNRAGRDEPSHLDVRPGFRIAPVVIRRADILRFMDTDALSRGTVFFDYFPDPNGDLAIRPDEELTMLSEEGFLLRVARDDLAERLREFYPKAGVDFTNSQRLEEFVAQTVAAADNSEGDNPLDALPADVRAIIGELRTTQQRLSVIKNKVARGVETLNPIAYRSQLSRVVPILRTVTEDLTESFRAITRADHVTALRVLVAKSGPVSLDVVVEFKNGASALPQQAFSEGYKDLVALLFFLAVTKKAAEFGQAKVLVLDDALQSVDSGVRVGVMNYILENFKDWQLIVTGHDRAWLAQLRGLFARRGRTVVERTIARWSFTEGIEVQGAARTRAETLAEAIAQNDARMTASAAGLLLEEICQELSWRLETKTTRREGDRYTLGDLWPGVAKGLRNTSLGATVGEIGLRLDIRNLLGAHFSQWADSIPWSDVHYLATDVLAVYSAVYCPDCATWVTKSGGRCLCLCGKKVL